MLHFATKSSYFLLSKWLPYGPVFHLSEVHFISKFPLDVGGMSDKVAAPAKKQNGSDATAAICNHLDSKSKVNSPPSHHNQNEIKLNLTHNHSTVHTRKDKFDGADEVPFPLIIQENTNFVVKPVSEIYGAYIVRPRVFRDNRGFFQEVFNANKYPRVKDSVDGMKCKPTMRQCSLSSSLANTIRGVHCAPYGKLVQCTSGRIFDVIVDLRINSPTFRRWFGFWLSEETHEQVYIPPRCGHGFLAVEDNSRVLYSQEGCYIQGADVELNPFDEDIGIQWPPPKWPADSQQKKIACNLSTTQGAAFKRGYIVSSKDQTSSSLKELLSRLEDIQRTEKWCACKTRNNVQLPSSKTADQQMCKGDNKDLISDMKKSVRPHDLDNEDTDGVDFLVLGSTGFLGSATVHELKRQGRKVAVSSTRIEDFPGLCRELKMHSPIRAGVICCAGTAGNPNIQWCESHEPETIQLNVVGQLNVAEACRQHVDATGQPVHCTIISTGCIYKYDSASGHPQGGGPNTAFTENDAPNFNYNVYARLRIAMEQLLTPFENVLILRVTYPVDCAHMHPRSLVSKLLKYQQITSTPTSLTVMDDLWPRIPRLIDRRATGILNFNNKGTTDNNRILHMWRQYVDRRKSDWEILSPPLASSSASPRAHALLSCTKLQVLDPSQTVLDVNEAISQGFQKLAASLQHRKSVDDY